MYTAPATFRVDHTPRRAAGEYMAPARISCSGKDWREYDVKLSGDLAGFDLREDAIRFATDCAAEWLEKHFGWCHPPPGIFSK